MLCGEGISGSINADIDSLGWLQLGRSQEIEGILSSLSIPLNDARIYLDSAETRRYGKITLLEATKAYRILEVPPPSTSNLNTCSQPKSGQHR